MGAHTPIIYFKRIASIEVQIRSPKGVYGESPGWTMAHPRVTGNSIEVG